MSIKYRYFISCLILLLSFNSYSSEIDIAKKIIKNKFPSYRLAEEKDFQTKVIYGEWGKDKGVKFTPQFGDFNNDSIQDLAFYIITKEPFTKIKTSGKEYKQKSAILLSCHGATHSKYECFQVIEEDMIYPFWHFHTVVNNVKTIECASGIIKKTESSIISVNPALGNVYSVYWFSEGYYQTCSLGD